jgi:hypothetical protein
MPAKINQIIMRLWFSHGRLTIQFIAKHLSRRIVAWRQWGVGKL